MSVLGLCALCADETVTVSLVDVRRDRVVFEGMVSEAKDSEFRDWTVESIDILDGHFLLVIR